MNTFIAYYYKMRGWDGNKLLVLIINYDYIVYGKLKHVHITIFHVGNFYINLIGGIERNKLT